VDHLTEKAAAWCALDAAFGRLDWTARRVHGWKSSVGGMVQTLRAGGDTIAIATAAEVRCFDAEHGKLL